MGIVLVDDGTPMLGVVSVTARNELYAGAAGRRAAGIDDRGQRPIICRPLPADVAIVAISRSHGDKLVDVALLEGVSVKSEVTASSALKFCPLASGAADAHPRAGRTVEWDTALAAAGGRLVEHSGQPLTYRKPDFENPSFVSGGLPSQS